MMALVAFLLVVAVAEAKTISNLADQQFRYTAEEWDTIYASAAEVNTAEKTTGLVLKTVSQPEDAGKVFEDPAERITSGTAAARGQFPWQALINLGGLSFCGGSLITTEWVLTAAHCLDEIKTFQITLGSIRRNATEPGVVTQNARQAIMHANYDRNTVANDIGLLRLTSEVSLTNYIKVVRLPSQAEANITFVGSSAIVSGFGRINSSTNEVAEVLLYANVEITTNTECVRSLGTTIKETNICSVGANGRGPCTGDSGGPLVIHEADGHNTLVGVVSVGTCLPKRATGYTRVSKYLTWISSHLSNATRH